MSAVPFSERCKATPVWAGFALLVGLVYARLSEQPLWHTDLWGHLAYGRLIWQRGTIPSTELLMPLSAGVRFVDTAWLSQWIGYAAHRAWGNAALQALYAAGIAACLSLLLWCCYRRTLSVGWTLAGCGLFAWVNWQQLRIVRPQLAGLVCFVYLLALLTSRRWSRANWLIVPIMFALWANLHGSFPMGLALLGCFCLGRAIDVTRRTGRLKAVLRDTRVRRYFLLTVLASASVLMNPYGWGLWVEVLSVPTSPNLQNLVEWQPLTLRMKQGRAAASAVLALGLVFCMTRRRITVAELLWLVCIGGATLWASRFVLWWAPVAGYCLAVYGRACKRKRKKERVSIQVEGTAAVTRPGRLKWAVLGVGFVLFSFVRSPLGLALVRGKQPDPMSSFSAQTPVLAAKSLKEHPPAGQVFNTFEWGDYLLWAGPRRIRVFVASHAHLVPRDVWQHYRQVMRLSPGWERILEHYAVTTIVIDKARRKSLIARLRRNAAWQVDYEDRLAVVFTRKGD